MRILLFTVALIAAGCAQFAPQLAASSEDASAIEQGNEDQQAHRPRQGDTWTISAPAAPQRGVLTQVR